MVAGSSALWLTMAANVHTVSATLMHDACTKSQLVVFRFGERDLLYIQWDVVILVSFLATCFDLVFSPQ